MPTVVYVLPDESRVEVHVENGSNVMQGAVDNMIEGIPGDCGGSCACATCHCYVDPMWIEKVGTREELESDMLECVIDPRENSRLSCQIIMRDELDGLVVTIPESQF